MSCYFCKIEKIKLYNDIRFCEYYICYKCWESIPEYIRYNYMQAWKFIQMKGDKIKNETL